MGYVIGVDGGATKTAAILADEQGHILSRAVAGASNYHAVGRESAGAALKEAIEAVVAQSRKSLDDCQMAILGLAGVNNETDQQILSEEAAKIGLSNRIRVENDIVIAWAASTTCQPGVVIIAGTGSSAFGVNSDGERIKSLGWDYILADQGSGYWVGLQGLQQAICVWDGRLTEGGELLYQAMLDHYKLADGSEAITLIYSSEFMKDMKTRIASFGQRVAECAKQGDRVAQQILHQAGADLGDGACAVIRRLDMTNNSFTVGMVGSTFKSGNYLMKPFTTKILDCAPQAIVQKSQYPAQVGALIYAYYELGMLSDEILENLKAD